MKENIDYQLFLDESGIDDAYVRAMSEDVSSQMLLNEYYGVSVKPSLIQGQGLFADKAIQSGMGVVPALIDGKKTIGGRFANHSGEPNAVMTQIDGNRYLIAVKDIDEGDEITADYRVSKKLQEDAHEAKITTLTAGINQAIDDGHEETLIEPTHHFSHGTYGRELFIKKDTFMAGKIHRYDCITILLKGHCRFVTENGDYDVIAPKVLVTGTGNKGIYAHEDSILMTVHPNASNTKDLNEIENNVIAPSYEALENI